MKIGNMCKIKIFNNKLCQCACINVIMLIYILNGILILDFNTSMEYCQNIKEESFKTETFYSLIKGTYYISVFSNFICYI